MTSASPAAFGLGLRRRLWLEPADGRGFSIVLFETEEQAREAAPPVSSWAAPGIAITGVEFRRVAATA